MVSVVAASVQKESLSLQRESVQMVSALTESVTVASYGARVSKGEPNRTGSFSWVGCCWPLSSASFWTPHSSAASVQMALVLRP
jgi:hypothetical protein